MTDLNHIRIHRSAWHDFDKPMKGPFYAALFSEEQRALYGEWLFDTSQRGMFGEMSVAGISLLTGLILGNNITRVLQCGHFAGYSSLMLGWMLQKQNLGGKILSVDIDQVMTKYMTQWLCKGDLEKTVFPLVADSGDPWVADQCVSILGGRPQLVFIDSSHQYQHTIEELDLWASHIEPGGFLALHDVSRSARSFDHHGAGGVREAVQEWLARHRNVEAILIDPRSSSTPGIYRDPCGFGLLHIVEPTRCKAASPCTQRIISDPSFRSKQSWHLGDGWQWDDSGPAKTAGTSSTIDTLAPIIAGQRYRVEAALTRVKAGGVHPAVGGSEIGAFFERDGIHVCEIIAGAENANIGLLASSDFSGAVLSLKASRA